MQDALTHLCHRLPVWAVKSQTRLGDLHAGRHLVTYTRGTKDEGISHSIEKLVPGAYEKTEHTVIAARDRTEVLCSHGEQL